MAKHKTRPVGGVAGSHLGKTFFADTTPGSAEGQGAEAVHFLWRAVEVVENRDLAAPLRRYLHLVGTSPLVRVFSASSLSDIRSSDGMKTVLLVVRRELH